PLARLPHNVRAGRVVSRIVDGVQRQRAHIRTRVEVDLDLEAVAGAQELLERVRRVAEDDGVVEVPCRAVGIGDRYVVRGIDHLRAGGHAIDDLAAAGDAGRRDAVAGAEDEAEIELERRRRVFLLREAGRRIAGAEEKEAVGGDAGRRDRGVERRRGTLLDMAVMFFAVMAVIVGEGRHRHDQCRRGRDESCPKKMLAHYLLPARRYLRKNRRHATTAGGYVKPTNSPGRRYSIAWATTWARSLS